MANGFLLRSLPLVFAGTSTASNGIDPAFPLTHLANPQPKVVAQTNVQASTNHLIIDIDLGADVTLNTVIVMHANLSLAGGLWRVFGATRAQGLGPIFAEPPSQNILGFNAMAPFGVAPTTRQRRRHAVAAAQDATVGWLRIILQDDNVNNPEALIRVGTIGIGRRMQPAFNFELGSGRRVSDRSVMRQLPGGEVGGQRGAKVPITRVTWGDLTDAELRSVWSLLLDVGESEPVFLVEDPDPTTGQCERIHYGTFQSLDFYERTIPDKSKIELQLVEWL